MVDLSLDNRGLFAAKAVERIMKTRMKVSMKTRRQRRHKTPSEFMLTACAGLKNLNTLLDGPLDRPIETGLKMEVWDVMKAPPVTTIKARLGPHTEGACDGLTLALGVKEDDLVRR